MSKPSLMSKLMRPAYKKVSRCVGYALTLGDDDGWISLAEILAARLTQSERMALGYAALCSVDQEKLEGAGYPLPFGDEAEKEAEYWADRASDFERAAYLMACWQRLSKESQQGLLAVLTGDNR